MIYEMPTLLADEFNSKVTTGTCCPTHGTQMIRFLPRRFEKYGEGKERELSPCGCYFDRCNKCGYWRRHRCKKHAPK